MISFSSQQLPQTVMDGNARLVEFSQLISEGLLVTRWSNLRHVNCSALSSDNRQGTSMKSCESTHANNGHSHWPVLMSSHPLFLLLMHCLYNPLGLRLPVFELLGADDAFCLNPVVEAIEVGSLVIFPDV
jgi:hypothetical protein